MSEISEKIDSKPPLTPAMLTASTPTTTVRYLTPDMCRIHLGNLGALHVTVMNEGIYGGVYAAYAFPVAYPSQYISMIQSTGKKDLEIGVIRNLEEFPPEAVKLVREALNRRYFVHVIRQIHSIHWQYGLIAFDVDTDKGRSQFFMRWSHDRAVDYGQTGKVLIDLENNRYLIPDLTQLGAEERGEFERYIYW